MADQQFPKTSAQLRLWKMSFDLAAVVVNLKPQLLNSQAQSLKVILLYVPVMP